jgi:kinesin family protein C2/C3
MRFLRVRGRACLRVLARVRDCVPMCMCALPDRYNVCIFAYGQTGSGKTHTMQGPDADPGVNTRALRRLFEVQRSAT